MWILIETDFNVEDSGGGVTGFYLACFRSFINTTVHSPDMAYHVRITSNSSTRGKYWYDLECSECTREGMANEEQIEVGSQFSSLDVAHDYPSYSYIIITTPPFICDEPSRCGFTPSIACVHILTTPLMQSLLFSPYLFIAVGDAMKVSPIVA